MGIEAPPNKAMEPTEQGECSHSFFQPRQKGVGKWRRSPGSVGATTIILPPRLIAGR
jgi:hypothetical protein